MIPYKFIKQTYYSTSLGGGGVGGGQLKGREKPDVDIVPQ